MPKISPSIIIGVIVLVAIVWCMFFKNRNLSGFGKLVEEKQVLNDKINKLTMDNSKLMEQLDRLMKEKNDHLKVMAERERSINEKINKLMIDNAKLMEQKTSNDKLMAEKDRLIQDNRKLISETQLKFTEERKRLIMEIERLAKDNRKVMAIKNDQVLF